MIFLLVLCAVVLLICLALKTRNGTYSYWKKCGIPQPSWCLPLIGHTWPILIQKTSSGTLFTEFYKMFQGYSMVGVNNAGSPVLLIREPELAKKVLQSNFSSFHENSFSIDPTLDPLLAKNPFFSSGEEWVKARKSLTFAFTGSRLKILAKTVGEVSEKFIKYVDRRITESSMTSTLEIELKDLFTRFTGEVVANAGFGVEGFCFEKDDHPLSFRKAGEKLFTPSIINGLIQAFTFFFPKIGHIFQISFIPKDVDQFFRQLVKRILEERRNDGVRGNDFLQLVVDRERTEDEKIDELAITAHAFSFYLDGLETSSITLSLIGYQLATHLEVQEKLRQEIQSVLLKHDNVIDYETIKEMTYMDQVINESMRIHPAAGMILKKCTQAIDLVGSDGISCRLQPNTEVIIPSWGLQTDPKYWIDPYTFDPDRFSPDNKNDLAKFCFLPFGEGPRMCVGMRMAFVQMKAALAALLSNYSLELSPKTQVPLKMDPKSFLFYVVGGLWVRIKRL